MKNYYSLYEEMSDNNMMLSFKGEVNFEQVNNLLKMLEDRLELETDTKVRKKLYNVAVECFQNLGHHLDNESNPYNHTALVCVESYPDHYVVVTGNYLYNDKIDKIKDKIEMVNAASKEELKEIYKATLDNNEFSDKGTAGLGFIDIARKSGEKIYYKFYAFKEEISFFTLRVVVWKSEELKNTTNLLIIDSNSNLNMDSLRIEATKQTPLVKFDAETGVLELKGRSTPENPVEYYKPITEWLEKYAANAKPKTSFHVQLEYFNTSSSKCLLDVMKKLANLHKAGHDVEFNWWYEDDDEDMKETGEDYQDVLGIPFNIRVING